ncbi:hypothetical protein A5742_16140 [Mycolicibacterium fortuitum]|uniref:Uncharacterized protein n=1 Tax=Mycolicibacterium fortuitum TaxID=1766 RepID=A0ABD6QBM1_MYCFO|nr:hypothetical protein [Mycolicibacterium fortuitum]OMC32322.1 hypothetical protein A5742_16140 [Mycolicibacterium fortuitum]
MPDTVRATYAVATDAPEYAGTIYTLNDLDDGSVLIFLEELVTEALSVLAKVGIPVTRTPLRTADDKIYIALDGQEILARDINDDCLDAVHAVLGRLEEITAERGRRERWYVCGAPVGSAFFVTPEELVTSARVDVRQLNIGEQWYQISSHP